MAIQVSFRVYSSTQVRVGFTSRLHHRGSDCSFYANNGYEPDNSDALLLEQVMQALFTDDSGVEFVHATPFSLTINHSEAVKIEDIRYRVMAAARRTGSPVVEV